MSLGDEITVHLLLLFFFSLQVSKNKNAFNFVNIGKVILNNKCNPVFLFFKGKHCLKWDSPTLFPMTIPAKCPSRSRGKSLQGSCGPHPRHFFLFSWINVTQRNACQYWILIDMIMIIGNFIFEIVKERIMKENHPLSEALTTK